MNWLEIIVLPLIQGIAEFLPISSSGHLVIAEAVLGQPPNSTYNILLHGGTLASIL
ncbi:MAG: undecaprenyl-diphosphate phosphatase, partial [Planctomycetota bacterium]|nr:undecaprenyl-diphosphate phosphatase [Planctomycetota bacterium]